MKRKLLVPLFFILFTGCAVTNTKENMVRTFPGKMFSLKDGTELTFSMQHGNGSGTFTAFNPVSNENFTGQYTEIIIGKGESQSDIKNNWGSTTGSITTKSSGSGTKMKGFLKGDKGTVINLDIEMTYPTGVGEGVDNYGVHYQIQIKAAKTLKGNHK